MAARSEKRRFNARFLLIFSVAVFIVGVSLGVLVGYFIVFENLNVATADDHKDELSATQLMNEVKPEKLREYLKYFTNRPHLAGTEADNEQVFYTKEKWLEFGLDHVEAVPYEMYLSYPSDEEGKENKVEILDPNTGNIVFTSRLKEERVPNQPEEEDIVPPFNAYSAQGQVQGDVVYANFGRTEDFEYLSSNLSIDLTDKIALIRYGRVYRGNKVFNAAKYGMKAVILYSDSFGSTEDDADVYPESIYLPPSGAQRGSVLGDTREPLTPGYPATKYAYRYSPDEIDILPKIPVHPIGYADAAEIIRRMAGDKVIPEWTGGVDAEYRYGPGFRDQDSDKKVLVTIHSENKVTTSYNVIGMIRGEVEPDRYVLLGNHHDAWVYGALDPASGSAALMELARVFGHFVREGWRPRRSIVFCSWGAEEHGIMGSNEWVEEYAKNLATRAVAYFNVDTAVAGTHILNVRASASLASLVHEVTKKIPDPDPDENRRSIYDTRRHRYWPETYQPSDDFVPPVSRLSFGSDHTPFVQQLGIPAIDMIYMYNFYENYNLTWYPLYHTSYDTFHMYETYYDPEFKYMQGVARVWGEMTRSMADSALLPLNATDMAEEIVTYFHYQKNSDNGEKMTERGISFDDLEVAVNRFSNAANRLQEATNLVNKTDVMAVRLVNDQLMYMDRSFIDPLGLPGRPLYKHVLYARDKHNSYRSLYFPGLNSAVSDVDTADDPTMQWKEVEKELARLTYHMHSAASTLNDVTTGSLTRGPL